jgi:Methyltransferase domain
MQRERHGDKSWSIDDGASAELEMGEFLHGLVRMLKPDLVVETGTYRGMTAYTMALACQFNGLGRVVTCDPVRHSDMDVFLENDYLTYIQGSSLDLPELRLADLVFSDSLVPLRIEEYKLVKPGCVFVVHDTNNADDWTPKLQNWVRSEGGLTFPCGRGFGILIKP